MKRAAMLWCAAVCLVWAMVAQAQETMMGPPKVLVIQREVVKPGKNAAHAKSEANFVRAFSKANFPDHYIAATGLTGENRALFFVGFDSLAAWEASNRAEEKDAALSAAVDAANDKDGEYLSEFREAVFSYMDELSYHPQVPVAGTRYFRVFTIHVKPGHGQHFEEVRKIARAAHEKAGLQDHYAVFSTIAGAPTGTYLLFVPMKSLSEIDEFATVHGKAYKDALGEDGQKKLEEFEREAVESMESNILALAPEMSYPRKEWIDADRFWAPAAAAKPAAKKADKKADKK